ncbi:MAG: DUF3552 domain-containing protein, partial [Lachnospiraceae bacterium]|nr:DUF3552 domain-containing protein [Lachnospiraceae bacterium]
MHPIHPAVLIIAVIAAAVIAWFAAIIYRKKSYEIKVGKAEDRSKEIIDEAIRTAESKKREALLEAKEENMKAKNELEKESRDRRRELQHMEKRILNREESLDKKSEQLERREQSLADREDNLKKKYQEYEELHKQELERLEQISGYTTEQAKEYLLQSVEEDVKHDTAVMIREMEAYAKDEAGKKAKEYVISAIQRCAADYVAESTISVVPLPNDDMKGRIIGREG